MNTINFKDIRDVAIENFYQVIYINLKEGGCIERNFEDNKKGFKEFKAELKANGIKQQKKNGAFFTTELEEIKV